MKQYTYTHGIKSGRKRWAQVTLETYFCSNKAGTTSQVLKLLNTLANCPRLAVLVRRLSQFFNTTLNVWRCLNKR